MHGRPRGCLHQRYRCQDAASGPFCADGEIVAPAAAMHCGCVRRSCQVAGVEVGLDRSTPFWCSDKSIDGVTVPG